MVSEKRHRLTEKDKEQIQNYARAGMSKTQIARKMNCSRQNVSKFLLRKLREGFPGGATRKTATSATNDLSTEDTDINNPEDPGLAGEPSASAHAATNRLRLLNKAVRLIERKMEAGRTNSKDLETLRRLLELVKEEGGGCRQKEMPICEDCDGTAVRLHFVKVDNATCPACGHEFFWGDNGKAYGRGSDGVWRRGNPPEPAPQEPTPSQEPIKPPEAAPEPEPVRKKKIPEEIDLSITRPAYPKYG